jgi:hypothetical protein
LSALGHAEIDWSRNQWAVCPPVVARLPAGDGTAVLAGSRRAGTVDRLQESEISVLHISAEPATGDLPVPKPVLVQFDDLRELQAAAVAAGAQYVGCAATRLAERLPAVRLGSQAPPPAAGNTTLERLNGNEGMHFEEATADADGLYRLRLQGQARHLYRWQGDWHHCDLATGVFIDLARNGRSVMRWRAETGAGREHIGTLFVDWGAPLPALHARALTLCAGLPPRFSMAARTAIYGNVPRTIGFAVAKSLRQRIHTT